MFRFLFNYINLVICNDSLLLVTPIWSIIDVGCSEILWVTIVYCVFIWCTLGFIWTIWGAGKGAKATGGVTSVRLNVLIPFYGIWFTLICCTLSTLLLSDRCPWLIVWIVIGWFCSMVWRLRIEDMLR